jgi:hypothetical protein
MLSLSEFIILSLATPYRPFIANSNICCGLISKPISLCISLNNLFLIGLGMLVSYQEMVVKQQLSKSIKNDISFEKKLHDEVPSGKNYIIKNIKGKDFVVVKIQIFAVD